MSLTGKSLSVFTAACLLLAGTAPLHTAVGAETSQTAPLTEAQAVQQARALLNFAEGEYKLATAEYYEETAFIGLPVKKMWFLTFTTAESEPLVILDAQSGRLVFLNNPQYTEPTGEQTYLSPTEAHETALKFLQKMAPEELAQTEERFRDISWGLEHSFSFMRTVNGLPVSHQGLYVTVGWDGTITNYQMGWEPALQFPAADGVLTSAQAQKILADNVQLQLQYEMLYDESPELVYRPYFPKGAGLFARTGAMVNAPVGFTSPSEPFDTTPLAVNGPTAPAKLAEPLTRDAALAQIEALGLLPDGAAYTEGEYGEFEDGEWYLSFETADTFYTVRLDANTGELVEYYGRSLTEEEQPVEEPADLPVLSAEQLKAAALEHVKKLFPHRTGTLALQEQTAEDMFSFLYLVSGLPAHGHYLDLVLDQTDGSVIEVYQNFTEADTFPAPTPTVSLAEAKQAYAGLPIELYYGFEENEDGEPSSTPVLSYRYQQLVPSEVLVDATTGKLRGLLSKNGLPLPDDIYGHWAETALTLFAEKSLLHTDMMYAIPDEPITRSYLIELMVGHLQRSASSDSTVRYQDVTSDHPSFFAVNTAAQLGWIAKDTHFRPDDLITREEMAILMAKAAGLDPAPHQGDTLPYADAKDIAWWSYGAVALNHKHGWMQGSDDHKFHPQGDLTLAEAVSMLYQFKH